MKKTIGIFLMLVSVVVFGLQMSESIVFKQNVSGYLKRAADANTVELAEMELTKAIDYLEANELTSGYTSVFWKTPNEDIGFWYKNLKASQQELQNLESDSPMEITNVLINLRETLLDVGERTRVTVPKGISHYPHNGRSGTLALGSGIMLISGFAVFAAGFSPKASSETTTPTTA